MFKNKKGLSTILVGACLLGVVACGSDDDNDDVVIQQEQQQDEGTYRAVLSPLNTSVAGETAGTVEVVISGDNVSVKSSVTGSPRGVKHRQNIMVGSACPTADTNADTFIDIPETVATTGQILIPLDSDLSEQLNGIDYGPIANGSGNYVYRRSTTLTRMLADLNSPDPDTTDAIEKLPLGSNLNLDGRVVLIHGVARSTNLPDTVGSVGDLEAEDALPIACGTLVRVVQEETPPETPTTGGSTAGTAN